LLVDDTHYSLPEAGTPAYMAPEQLEGSPQAASDIYSLGVVLHQLCTGDAPSLLRLHKKPTLLNPNLPPALDDVIIRALSSEPSHRFASASLSCKAIQTAVRQTQPPRMEIEDNGTPLHTPTAPTHPPPITPGSAPSTPKGTGKTTKIVPPATTAGPA